MMKLGLDSFVEEKRHRKLDIQEQEGGTAEE